MAFKDLLNKAKSFLSGSQEQDASRMPNGGISSYRPTAMRKDPFATQNTPSLADYPVAGQPVQEPQPATAQAYPENEMAQAQQPQHTGWTGMQQAQHTGWTNAQQPQHTGWTGVQQPQRSGWTDMQQPQQQGVPTQDNISYMPGSFVAEDGRAYRHCERVALLVSVSACFRIIEFMRNQESVIVSMESISSHEEVQRCLDMLTGAAFTLQCSMTAISAAQRIYLIAPTTVMVMLDAAINPDSQSQPPRQQANPSAGWQQPSQATGWQQQANQAAGWQQPNQATGWQQQANQATGWQQQANQATGWQQPNQPRYGSAPGSTIRSIFGV